MCSCCFVVASRSLADRRSGTAKLRGKAASLAHVACSEVAESGMVVLLLLLESMKEMGKQEIPKDELEILGLWIQAFLWQLNCKEISLHAPGGTMLNMSKPTGLKVNLLFLL